MNLLYHKAMEIGIDIEQNSRFEQADAKLIERVFTKTERDYASKFKGAESRLCAMWCAKEATVKAFSDSNLSYLDIEILHEKSGKPYVKVTEKLKDELLKKGLHTIKISLSHSKDYSTAACLIY